MKELETSFSGRSSIEMLPAEILDVIIGQLIIDVLPQGITSPNTHLISLLLTSHKMYTATLATLYINISIPNSRIFRKFLANIREYHALRSTIRRLDFSHFNPNGIGLTARQRAETLNLTPVTLLESLSLMPNLREFLSQEHIEDDIDEKVIEKLLTKSPTLQALDFCACSSYSFQNAITTVINTCMIPESSPLKRLSFHECMTLQSSVFNSLFPRLSHLTHLDVAHTRITDDILFHIPHSAKLTHLNISKCSYLSGKRVVELLSTHPAVKSLVWLNLSSDIRYREMLNRHEVAALLPNLPDTLRSLNLKGSELHYSHIPLFITLTKHLEELGLGHGLALPDIRRLFASNQDTSIEGQITSVPHNLHYIDLSDLSKYHLDVGTLFAKSCPILYDSLPLEVIEINLKLFNTITNTSFMKQTGWVLKETGRRCWLVRNNNLNGVHVNFKERQWGMRKISVTKAGVGGMYDHYTFKR